MESLRALGGKSYVIGDAKLRAGVPGEHRGTRSQQSLALGRCLQAWEEAEPTPKQQKPAQETSAGPFPQAPGPSSNHCNPFCSESPERNTGLRRQEALSLWCQETGR